MTDIIYVSAFYINGTQEATVTKTTFEDGNTYTTIVITPRHEISTAYTFDGDNFDVCRALIERMGYAQNGDEIRGEA